MPALLTQVEVEAPQASVPAGGWESHVDAVLGPVSEAQHRGDNASQVYSVFPGVMFPLPGAIFCDAAVGSCPLSGLPSS